ncbi:helix-turn-helix transcriptional regulator [Clostridium perfringens]|nr:helix-turn-helix transcriptional regulator [Clostridium perfringens]
MITIDWSTFSKNIKKYRKSQKLTQEDLANKLGISRSTLSYYEHGNIEPNIFVLITLSKLMNCSIDSLIGLSKKEKSKILLSLMKVITN